MFLSQLAEQVVGALQALAGAEALIGLSKFTVVSIKHINWNNFNCASCICFSK